MSYFFVAKITQDEALLSLQQSVIPITITTAVFSSIALFTMNLNDRFMTKVSDKDDLFSNTGIIVWLLAFIDLQRIFFQVLLACILAFIHFDKFNYETPSDVIDMVGRMRYAIIAVEILFICVPLRHNFQLHRLEV